MAAMLRERGAKPLEVYGVVSRDHGAAEAIIALGDPGIALRRDDILTGREVSFDRWRGGTGLSVPIACRILEASGGRIWLPSQASRAACALSLPLDVP
jgi:signal transduction histidine kinase